MFFSTHQLLFLSSNPLIANSHKLQFLAFHFSFQLNNENLYLFLFFHFSIQLNQAHMVENQNLYYPSNIFHPITFFIFPTKQSPRVVESDIDQLEMDRNLTMNEKK